MQLKDFIVDDLDDEDEEDEDYDEMENNHEKETRFKTNLDMQDEFIFLRDVLNFLRERNEGYYNHLMMLMDEKEKRELGGYINKAEMRLNEKRNNI
jgi:hypothetical protein